MTMVYQKGTVFLSGTREKKWYGKFRVYLKGKNGEEVERTRKVVLAKKSELRKWEAEQKLQGIIRQQNGFDGVISHIKADDTVTFGWFVGEKYNPMRGGRWRQVTRKKTEFEINKYLVARFGEVPIRDVGMFELQVHLNKLAEEYSESIVKHAFANVRAIMRLARKLKYLEEDPAEELLMPQTREVRRPTMTADQIIALIDSIEDVHDLCLMSIGLFCATRTSETFGLTWKSYVKDKLLPLGTAYEGHLYEGRLKTRESRNAIPIPEDVIPIVEAWRKASPDNSPDALMFPTFGRGDRKGQSVPRQGRNFLKWRIYPIADKLGIPRKLVTFQVMRRTLGTDMQQHGTMKDTQQILRHASIKSTGEVYMQEIQASVRKAINSRTRAIFRTRSGESLAGGPLVFNKRQPNASKRRTATVPNGSKLSEEVNVNA
ncbi:MAG TPA: site-specific integrase [Candidatus Angelobacter sp.]|nr:site-specific integrase [Candidatus Angelobacter sp.]